MRAVKIGHLILILQLRLMDCKDMYYREDFHTATTIKDYSFIEKAFREIGYHARKQNQTQMVNPHLANLQMTCCNRVAERADHFIDLIEKTKEPEHETSRNARSIDGIGTFLKWIGGTPDSEDWQAATKAIEAMEMAEKISEREMATVIKAEEKQKEISSKTLKVVRNLSKHNALVSYDIANLKGQIATLAGLTQICIDKDAILDDLTEIWNEYREMTRPHISGRSIDVITKEKDLSKILYKLTGTSRLQPLWTGHDVSQYLWSKTLLKRAVHGLVVVEMVTIPLIDKGNKQEVLKTPLGKEGRIAINKRSSKYRYMNEHEWERCSEEGNLILCKGRIIEMSTGELPCENTEDCRTRTNWPASTVHEISNNTFVYTMVKGSLATLNCAGTKTKVEMKKTGMITVGRDCQLYNTEMLIREGVRRTNESGDNFTTSPWTPRREKEVDLAVWKHKQGIQSSVIGNISEIEDKILYLDTDLAQATGENEKHKLLMKITEKDIKEMKSSHMIYKWAFGSGLAICVISVISVGTYMIRRLGATTTVIHGVYKWMEGIRTENDIDTESARKGKDKELPATRLKRLRTRRMSY